MTPCVIWTGFCDRDGYGVAKIDGKSYRVHRLSLAKKLGRKLLSTEWALHSCHVRPCFNPDHLRIGNAADNNRDIRERYLTEIEKSLGDLNEIRRFL